MQINSHLFNAVSSLHVVRTAATPATVPLATKTQPAEKGEGREAPGFPRVKPSDPGAITGRSVLPDWLLDMESLEAQLKAAEDARFKLIATDGVFSMDGIIANLQSICDLAAQYGAITDSKNGVYSSYIPCYDKVINSNNLLRSEDFVFISYSNKDRRYVDFILQHFENLGIRYR